MIVYFSGTGNSRFAAEYLAKQLEDELLDAGQRIKAEEKTGEKITADQVCGNVIKAVFRQDIAAISSHFIVR